LRVAPEILLTDAERTVLTQQARGRSVPVRVCQRAKILLMAAEGQRDKDIANALSTTRATVARWRGRFLHQGLAGIEHDAPRPGRKPSLPPDTVEEIVRKTTQEKPAEATQWSTRSMARATGVSEATVRRIWRKHGLKPHRVRTFKLSNDPRFAEKLTDVVGLYLDPPEQAIVLSLDEKTQIQALDRTQPGLPIKKGRAETMTHDYKRHGTTTLFAALNTLDGTVIGTCMKQHRHEEWLKFLRLIDRETPPDKDLHLIADNYATHKHPDVLAWLERHPRFHVHFTPTSASWANMVERFFRDITDQRIRRGVFRSVVELEQAITDYLAQHNQAPKPFIWTKRASDILEKVKRGRAALENKARSV
jgi:transposase